MATSVSDVPAPVGEQRRPMMLGERASAVVAFIAAMAMVISAFILLMKVTDASTLAERFWWLAEWLAGGLFLGLLVVACRPLGAGWNARPLAALCAWLASQWRSVLLTYAVVVVLWSLTAAMLRVGYWITLFQALFSYYEPSADSGSNFQVNAICVVAFLVAQGVFVSGVGGIRIGRTTTNPFKLTGTLAVFAMFMGLVAWGLLLAMLQLTDRLGDAGPDRGSVSVFGSPGIGLPLLGASWMLWLGVGWVLSRGVRPDTAVARMLTLIFVGSWVEFAVALPVELVTRDRTKDCPCNSGSLIALVSTGPLLLWAIGPAILLLFRHEWMMTETNPEHARRVLQRKTRRIRVER